MSLSFKPITIKDRDTITSFTLPGDYRNCDFSFANMCSWRFLYDTEFAVSEGFLFIRFFVFDKTRVAYMMPVGSGDLRKAIRLLEDDAKAHNNSFLLLGITPDAQAELERGMPGEFSYKPQRDYFDYIYLRDDLVNLRGKKYQSKRNHINNFKKQYAYRYMPITPELVPECLALEKKWYKENQTEEDKEELSHERRAIIYALNHFDELGLTGGAICAEGQIVAFSFGRPINHNTFGVHIEKADITYDGAYALINQEFASHLPEQYTYINREEDLGIPGLRQSKLSYHPVELLEKYTVHKTAKHTNGHEPKRANQDAVAGLL